mmetsp:Transcript_83784/g.233685  ORF Transcript_83784/g.233685 Transcript_83784/m.233685 type:complete len:224 (+) Transcript_83784:587-1258(+)
MATRIRNTSCSNVAGGACGAAGASATAATRALGAELALDQKFGLNRFVATAAGAGTAAEAFAAAAACPRGTTAAEFAIGQGLEGRGRALQPPPGISSSTRAPLSRRGRVANCQRGPQLRTIGRHRIAFRRSGRPPRHFDGRRSRQLRVRGSGNSRSGCCRLAARVLQHALQVRDGCEDNQIEHQGCDHRRQYPLFVRAVGADSKIQIVGKWDLDAMLLVEGVP